MTNEHVFLFLEVFNTEGGIQSYVKDILQAYRSVSLQTGRRTTAEVFLLRDDPNGENPFDVEPLKFHYLKKRTILY